MMKFEMNIDSRKKLAARLAELTGVASRYSGVPNCVYYVGDYTVGRDGSIEVEEGLTDPSVINTLISEGMLKGDMLPFEEAPDEAEAPAELEEAGEPTVTENLAATEEPEESQQEEAPAEVAEAPAEEEQTDAEAVEEATDEPLGEEQVEEATEDEAEAENPIEEEAQVGGDFLTISVPAEHHTGTSLRNLIYLLYSRGPLLNKALGTHFEVEDSLVEALKDDKCTVTPLALRQAVADYEDADGNGLGMEGITITPEQVSFHGFPIDSETADGDADRVKACTDLVALMNRMALSQKRIQAKKVNVENEKYAMRIWLVRMGMGGAEYKQTGAILMENLGGNGAFRTEADAEKFKAKQKAKREAKKAADAAALGETGTEVHNG